MFPSEDQIKAAYPKSTQTIEIEAFVKATEIPLTLLQTPYYLEPLGRGEKVYPLLCESVFKAGVIGIARVVMHTKERLAALTSSGAALVLNALRWGAEIRPLADLKPSAEGKAAAGPKPAELMRAAQLFGDKTGPWKSDDCSDKFSDAIPALMRKKLEAGETATIATLEDAPAQGASNVIDLTDLLAKSLTRRKPAGGAEHGSRATVVGAKKAASKASTRRQA